MEKATFRFVKGLSVMLPTCQKSVVKRNKKVTFFLHSSAISSHCNKIKSSMQQNQNQVFLHNQHTKNYSAKIILGFKKSAVSLESIPAGRISQLLSLLAVVYCQYCARESQSKMK